MAKKIQFKAPHGRMVTQKYGEVTNANLTEELYNKIVADSDGAKEFFEVIEEVSKPTKKENVSTDSKA